jgi:hypothetical protein
MGTVRKIHIAKTKRPEDVVATLRSNFKQYNETVRISNLELEDRISICAKCAKCIAGLACEVVGNCGTGKKDFFTMHLNRENGGCPTGQW